MSDILSKRIDIVLIIILVLSIIYQTWLSIRFMYETNHIIPDQVNLVYVSWQQSSDQFLAVPNLFLLPLSFLFVKKAIQRFS